MTRRERAAMELALSVLRERVSRVPRSDARAINAIGEAAYLLYLGPPDLRCVADIGGNPHLLVIRLALYLRARLRAERGDCGPIRCRDCGRPAVRHARARHCLTYHGPRQTLLSRRITPWWQQPDMPSYGGGR